MIIEVEIDPTPEPSFYTCTRLVDQIQRIVRLRLDLEQEGMLVDYNITDEIMGLPVMQTLLKASDDARREDAPRWSAEDLQRVLFHIVCTYEQAVREMGGDSEFLREAILMTGKNTLIDNNWWPEGKDRNPELGLPKPKRRRRRWSLRR